MQTTRKASMGYGGCKHASTEYTRSGFSTYRRRRGYGCRRRSATIRNKWHTIALAMLVFMLTMIMIVIPAIGGETIHRQANSFRYYAANPTPSSDQLMVGANAIRPMMTNVHLIQMQTVVTNAVSSMEQVKESIDDPPVVEIDPATLLAENLGNPTIEIDGSVLRRYDLPDKYYPGIDFSSFQPYMGYKCITNKSSQAYKITRSEMAYNDEYGMRRYRTTPDQFTINGQDDYVIALGTFYKEKGTAGSRYLIVTSTGMYTAITGDEKSDAHTDPRHMFSTHQDGSCAGIIEWIVDQENLESSMRRAGTITAGPIEPLKGEILHIYGIN